MGTRLFWLLKEYHCEFPKWIIISLIYLSGSSYFSFFGFIQSRARLSFDRCPHTHISSALNGHRTYWEAKPMPQSPLPPTKLLNSTRRTRILSWNSRGSRTWDHKHEPQSQIAWAESQLCHVNVMWFGGILLIFFISLLHHL